MNARKDSKEKKPNIGSVKPSGSKSNSNDPHDNIPLDAVRGVDVSHRQEIYNDHMFASDPRISALMKNPDYYIGMD